MTKDQFCQEAWRQLQKIEGGEISVELISGDILAGKVEYQTSSGWKIIVFSDGDVWDYIRSMVPPTMEHFDIWPENVEDDCEAFRRLRAYHPPGDQLQNIWGFLV